MKEGKEGEGVEDYEAEVEFTEWLLLFWINLIHIFYLNKGEGSDSLDDITWQWHVYFKLLN